MEINENLLRTILKQAEKSERKRINYDLRTSFDDGSQRMLNALLPGTEVSIHRHPFSTENVIILRGRVDEVFYDLIDGQLKETARYNLNSLEGVYGCQVPKGKWHTVEVFEPSVIYEAKDGRYGHDGSEVIENLKEYR